MDGKTPATQIEINNLRNYKTLVQAKHVNCLPTPKNHLALNEDNH